MNCVINDKELMIASIYVPNNDSLEYFVQFFQTLAESQYGDVIIAEDFNLVLDEQKDSLNRTKNNQKACSIVNNFCEEAMMIDIWRQIHPEMFQFTWH